MTGPSGAIARRSLAGAAVLALAACSRLFVATPPGKLYRLSPVDGFSPRLRPVAATLIIDLPQATPGIDTRRIALSRSPISLDYYADAEWTDPVPELMQNLLLDSFENSGAIITTDRFAGLRADFLLRTEIRHFEAEYGAGSESPRARVAIIARLVGLPRRAIISQRQFDERAAAAANDVPAVVTAFDTATTEVLRGVVLWTLGDPALSQSHR